MLNKIFIFALHKMTFKETLKFSITFMILIKKSTYKNKSPPFHLLQRHPSGLRSGLTTRVMKKTHELNLSTEAHIITSVPHIINY